jgi:penicillin-binding protein activator
MMHLLKNINRSKNNEKESRTMKWIHDLMIAALFVVIAFLFNACASMTQGQQGDVAILDTGSRAHLQTELTMGDYIAFAEKVTNKMLTSPLVQSWGTRKPKLIVGDLVNNTDNENIRMKDVHDRIQETIFNSGLVRVVDSSATSFDYVIKSELTSTRQSGNEGQELAYFTLQLKMYKLDGELVGQWSDDLPLGKGKKRLF